MLTLAIMGVIALGLALLLILRDQKGRERAFFDVESTNSLRGFWCIIILLVHVPADYQNTVQDLLGSFAYIGVSFFFMTSGYGLMLNMMKNPLGIRSGFWRKRLPKLLLPMLLANIITIASDLIAGNGFKWWQIISITGFVRQLLLFYFIFWLVFRFVPDKLSLNSRSNIICLCVLVFSVTVYIWENQWLGWATESFGFIYGILFARYKDKFESFANSKWLLKVGVFCALSLALGLAYMKLKHIPVAGDYVTKILLGIFILAFLLIFSARRTLSNFVSRALGKISYEVYLIHAAVFVLLSALPVKLDSGVFVLGSIVVTILISMLINVVGTKILAVFNKK